MIIKRFKEIKNKWSENDIKNHLGNDRFLKDKLSEYLDWKLNKNNNPRVEYIYYNQDDDGICYLHYYTDSADNERYDIINKKEMTEFINNSELYKSSKKYNI